MHSVSSHELSLKQRLWNPEARLAYVLMAPTVLFLAAFLFFPIGYVFVMSFFRTNKLSELTEFVGLANYVERLKDREFWETVGRSMVWTATGVVVKSLMGMVIALLLNVEYKGRKVMRMLFIIPWASSVPISALLWQWVYHPEFGLLNHTLKATGIWTNPPTWLGEQLSAFIACMWVDIWAGIPFFALVFLAGMQAIPPELYESGQIDGVNGRQAFRWITLPGLRDLILISTMLSAIWTFNDFNVIYILTRGGPAGATNILTVSVYMNAFVNLKFDKAAVTAVFVFLILTAVSIVYARFYFRKEND